MVIRYSFGRRGGMVSRRHVGAGENATGCTCCSKGTSHLRHTRSGNIAMTRQNCFLFSKINRKTFQLLDNDQYYSQHVSRNDLSIAYRERLHASVRTPGANTADLLRLEASPALAQSRRKTAHSPRRAEWERAVRGACGRWCIRRGRRRRSRRRCLGHFAVCRPYQCHREDIANNHTKSDTSPSSPPLLPPASKSPTKQ